MVIVLAGLPVPTTQGTTSNFQKIMPGVQPIPDQCRQLHSAGFLKSLDVITDKIGDLVKPFGPGLDRFGGVNFRIFVFSPINFHFSLPALIA